MAGGVLAQAQGGQQIGGGGYAILVGEAAQVLVADLTLRHLEFTRLALQQLAADFDGPPTMIFVEPVLDLVASAWTFHKRQPVAAGLVVLLGDNFNNVAGAQLGAQLRHAPVDLGAHAGVAYFGVNGVSKINRRAVGRNHYDLPLGREGVHLVGIEIHLQAGEKLVGVGHLLLPVDQLPDPVQPLLVACRYHASAGFVFPVGGNAFLGDAMHLLGANLHLELVAGRAHHRGVQRLVTVGAGHGDKILDAAGHRAPQGVNEAENGVAGSHILCNDANCQQVIDLVKGDFGALLLLKNGIDALDAPLDPGRNVVFAQLLGQRVFHAAQELFALGAAGFNGLRDLFIADRVGVAEGKILQLAAHLAHAQTVRQRRVDLQGLASNGLLALRPQVLQCTHVVQPVRQLDEHHAHV